MNRLSTPFRRRLTGLIFVLGLGVVGCVLLAVQVARDARGTVGQLAKVELESARLARDFRRAVDELHGALLRLGGEDAAGHAAVLAERQVTLATWLRERRAAVRGEQEQRVLDALGTQLAIYFRMLATLAARPGGTAVALDRAEVMRFDDMAVRVQSHADDFDAVQDVLTRTLLEDSLGAVRRLRNLVFSCLGLLLAASGAVGAVLYRDLVRPLRARLVEREALLEKREKLAALGTLAAGVAHEIRNPLTAIKARLFTLRRSTTSAEAREDTAAIAAEIDRLEGIVRDVLGYARPAEPRLAAVELSAWVRQFADFEIPALRVRGAEVTVVTSGPLWVRADAAQLRQIALNLTGNAADALAGRAGRIILDTRPGPGGMVVLSVTDDGPGIPASQHARLFDPFYTTKAAGTGLGLSIVARLVEAHRGQISFQSAPGVGTHFEVRLPRAPEPVRVAA